MTTAKNIDGDKKEAEAFIPQDPVELPIARDPVEMPAEYRASELPAEHERLQVSALTSPVEMNSDDEVSRSGHSPRLD